MQDFYAGGFIYICSCLSQNDKISLHSGKVIEGNVVRVGEFTVVFKYVIEDAEQTVTSMLYQNYLWKEWPGRAGSGKDNSKF